MTYSGKEKRMREKRLTRKYEIVSHCMSEILNKAELLGNEPVTDGKSILFRDIVNWALIYNIQ